MALSAEGPFQPPPRELPVPHPAPLHPTAAQVTGGKKILKSSPKVNHAFKVFFFLKRIYNMMIGKLSWYLNHWY